MSKTSKPRRPRRTGRMIPGADYGVQYQAPKPGVKIHLRAMHLATVKQMHQDGAL